MGYSKKEKYERVLDILDNFQQSYDLIPIELFWKELDREVKKNFVQPIKLISGTVLMWRGTKSNKQIVAIVAQILCSGHKSEGWLL